MGNTRHYGSDGTLVTLRFFRFGEDLWGRTPGGTPSLSRRGPILSRAFRERVANRWPNCCRRGAVEITPSPQKARLGWGPGLPHPCPCAFCTDRVGTLMSLTITRTNVGIPPSREEREKGGATLTPTVGKGWASPRLNKRSGEADSQRFVAQDSVVRRRPRAGTAYTREENFRPGGTTENSPPVPLAGQLTHCAPRPGGTPEIKQPF